MKRYVNRDILLNQIKGGMPLAGVVGRRTGRTTAVILGQLAQAISRPQEPILIWDHSWPAGVTPEPRQLTDLRRQVEKVISLLGLEKITVKVKNSDVFITSEFVEEIN